MANRQQEHKVTQNEISRWPIPLYVPVFIKLTWSYTEPADYLVHYSLLIWSHTRTKRVSFHLKTIFFMEPPKANTVWIVKNSPSLRTTRKTFQFFRACSGLLFFPQNDNKPNYPLLLELPYLRIKPKAQSQQCKKCYEILSNPEDFTCHVASKHRLGRRMPGCS